MRLNRVCWLDIPWSGCRAGSPGIGDVRSVISPHPWRTTRLPTAHASSRPVRRRHVSRIAILSEHIWIYASVFAAALQCVRMALQRQIAADYGDLVGASARYVLSAPLATLAAAMIFLGGMDFPDPGPVFLAFAALTSVSQIVASIFLLRAFSQRSFAVGATLSRTESLQVALLTPLLLNEYLGPATIAGVLVSALGVTLLSMKRGVAGAGLLAQMDGKTVSYGLLAGFFFALSSIFIRKANIDLGDAPVLARSMTTLVVVTWLQTILMLPFVAARVAGRFIRLTTRPGIALSLAVATVGGSIGWYVALSLATAARVQVVGQVGVVFIMLTSWIYFRERPTAMEIVGAALVVTGILCVVAYG